jgi:DNA-directed RNA polymerase specialized sigma24 family protein
MGMERARRDAPGQPIGISEPLIEGAHGEQARLLQQLADLHANTLLLLASRLVGRRDAHDVAQDAFISLARWIMKQPVLEARALLDAHDELSRFMFRVTACRAYDFWRKRSRRELVTDDGGEIEHIIDDRHRDPGIALELARLDHAYAALPPAQRIAHVLHHYYGFTDADFEATLGLTRTNSRTLVRRANLALKRAMEMK